MSGYNNDQSTSADLAFFLESEGFQELKNAGFLDWGDKESFTLCYEAGEPKARRIAQELLDDEQNFFDNEEESHESSHSENNSVQSTTHENQLGNSSETPIRDQGSKEVKASSKPSNTDIKLDGGRFKLSDGSNFELSNTEKQDSVNKQILRLLNSRTMLLHKRRTNLTAEQIIRDKQAGISSRGREYFNRWANRQTPNVEIIEERKFLQPANGYNYTEAKDRNSQKFRLPTVTHIQGLELETPLKNLPGEEFDKTKNATSRAKKFNTLPTKTSVFEIHGNRYLVANAQVAYDGIARLTQLLSLSLPEAEDSNKKM